MLCVLVFVFLVPGLSGARWTQEQLDKADRDAERSNYSCVIPPSDVVKNGRFTVEGYDEDEQPAAGKKAYFYDFLFTCNPGFTRRGLYLVQCVTNKGTDEFPECLPTCKTSAPDVWSCGSGFGAGEAKCLAPTDSSNAQISLRQKPQLQCGVIPEVWRTTVVNGRKANREDVPWHAGVYTKTTRPYMQICGGTIVSNNVVVSAAHCFWTDVDARLPAANYAVAVGKLYRPWNDPNDPDAQKFDVQELRIPPRFQGSATNFQDDIALLILAAPFIQFSSFIIPACLDFNFEFDTKQLAHGKLGRVAGWGLDSADGPSSQTLNVAELPVVGIEQCIASSEPSFLSSITSDKICAGYTNGTTVCKGDSGGGLLFPGVVGGATRYFLRGLVSTAPRSDHLCNIYAVATFTQVHRHEHFILASVNQELLPTEAPKVSPITISPAIVDNNTNSSNHSTGAPETSKQNALIRDRFLTLGDTNVNNPKVESTTTIIGAVINILKNRHFLPETFHLGLHNPVNSLQTSTESTKITVTKQKVADKTDQEPITNPPTKSTDNFAENSQDKDINVNKDKEIGINNDEVIGITKDQSFENVNTNPKTDESSEVISNDNIAKTPDSVPIRTSIGQTDKTENSDQNPQNAVTNKRKGPTKDTETILNTNTNDKLTPLDSPVKPNVGQIPQTAKPEASFSLDIPTQTTDIFKDKQVPDKDASINYGSTTIWPAKPVGSNQNPGSSNTGVQNTDTPAVLEGYWGSAGWDCDHNYPGHYHHHGPHHHSWYKHPTGQGQGSQHNWQNWNPTNWQQQRSHPFAEYHYGFAQQPSKPSSNYGAWFSKYIENNNPAKCQSI